MGQQLMGLVLTKEEGAGKIYSSNDMLNTLILDQTLLEERIQSICSETGLTLPYELINNLETRWFAPPDYGLPRFTDIFSRRQLLALLTFISEVHHAYNNMLEEKLEAERAVAIVTYLALMIDRLADYNS